MAETKNITAEQLVEVLKFTPRTYTIQMWGYGGEKVMGRVDPKAWDYCVKNRIDLVDMAWGDYDEFIEEQGLDIDQLPFTPGSWYECDSMAHVHGVSRNAGTLQISDENGATVFEKSFDDIVGGGCDGEAEWCCNDEVWIGQAKKGEVVFIGSSNEKGTFFEGNIELTEPFDIEKLVLNYDEVDGEDIINSVYYNDEEIENYGGSTDGKSSDMDMVRLIDDEGNWERYEVPDTDESIDFPASACTSETWDPVEELDKILVEFDEIADELKTDWFAKEIKPVHKGEYECEFVIATWPWPAQRMCEWTGKTWKDADGEKIKSDFKWRGLKEQTL
jgi:hypothetical protein